MSNALKKMGKWVSVLALSACISAEGPFGADGQPQVGLTAAEAEAISQASASAEAGRAFLADTTALGYGAGSGVQILYLAPGGTLDLWKWGGTYAYTGQWRVQDAASGAAEICLLFGEPSVHTPVQLGYGSTWKCEPLGGFVMKFASLAKGDPFQLADGRTPFVLAPETMMTMEALQTQAGSAVSQRGLSYRFHRITAR